MMKYDCPVDPENCSSLIKFAGCGICFCFINYDSTFEPGHVSDLTEKITKFHRVSYALSIRF